MSFVAQTEATKIITLAPARRRMSEHPKTTMTRSKAIVNILNGLSHKQSLGVQLTPIQTKMKVQNKKKPKMCPNSRSNNTHQE